MASMHITPNVTLGMPVPVLDEAGKQIFAERDFNGAKRKVPLHETIHLPASKTVVVDAKLAKELIAAGLAREADDILDGDDSEV